ncbi:hypothetical protein [Actinoplanes sp. NBRC 101535]|uniref:hypothetical protein n=1 Tax=Actinoplanes sp. NBRC 101535 TaxID=3032196 RepID=UPI00249FC1DD|nr:hypothetical protein [Actinoplanes sp. NBRC 101535]GLY03035.1 hypothetical protein Acsp01_34140 [Actinoplanes sp. NBRC 101535]
MTDHWDDDDFDLPAAEHDAFHDHHEEHFELPGYDHDHDTPDWEEPAEIDTEAVAAVDDDTMFPAAVDIGELPEPVDGFPWIDTATLGIADPGGFTAPVETVTAQEVAAYAGVDVPDGADAWTVLAAAEDPATSALARWWTPDEQ